MPLKRPLYWALKAAIVPWEWLSPPWQVANGLKPWQYYQRWRLWRFSGIFAGKNRGKLRMKTWTDWLREFWEKLSWDVKMNQSELLIGLLDDKFRMTNNPTAEMIPCQINKASVWWFMNLIHQSSGKIHPACAKTGPSGFDSNSMARCARIPLPSVLPSLPAKEVHDKHWAQNDSNVLFVGWWF